VKELTTYLNFDGNCREAMTFYSKCLGVELQVMDFPEHQNNNRVMHARLSKGVAPILMASDTQPGQPVAVLNSFSVAIACESMEEIQKLFAALGENGKVTMPLQDTFWGAHFGMLTDQFGINWMFNFDKPK
jgi:PhnB protein